MPSSRDLEQVATTPSPAQQAQFIGQATAVEQARAVAEVQAAVVVAQQVPRDMGRAVAEMRDACGRVGLAQRAFYAVPNRGSGPSVHLARELGRIFGNVQYGVHELRRDDDAGISEVQAFAWDVERNTRSVRTFVVPHARMKGRDRQKLIDLGDIYANNQNVGARAVRECIFTILPAWFTDEAQDLCQKTLRDGEGVPLETRISNAVARFRNLGVTVEQLEGKVGRRRVAWTPGDLAQLTITWTSIDRGEVRLEDEFPQRRVAAEEITGQPAAASPEPAEAAQQPQEPSPAAWSDVEVAQPGGAG